MTVFEETKQMVEDGAKFSIDLKNRSLKIDGKYIIKDGVYNGEAEWVPFTMTLEQVTQGLATLYAYYKVSVPSERTGSYRRTYFKALKEKDISNEDFMYGERRETAQFNLEYAVLEMSINGVFDDNWNEWFGKQYCWRNPKDTDLVIMKEWVVKQ